MMHRIRDISLLPEPGALEDPSLELQGRLVEVAGEPGMFHKLLVANLEVGRGAVTGVVDEVDGSRTSHDVDSGSENEKSGANDDTDEIVLEVKPKLMNVIRVFLGGLHDDEGH